eukprot:TRINITY_DN16693_c0_g1_i1.p1 TRINITY_DN16693_c0_g1~~TRINITY_DN16693_c0_g1_i1.p1  ORF type:complete len:640 (+),score=16.91 TRINITY_DN16693_c0_g1_i1:124-1920(+)
MQKEEGLSTNQTHRMLLQYISQYDHRFVHRNVLAYGKDSSPIGIRTIIESDNNEFDNLLSWQESSQDQPSNIAGPGVFLYLLPLGKANRKDDSWSGWGYPYGSFWCCYGTSIESFVKLQDSIYFWRVSTDQKSVELFINQFVSSTLQWQEEGIAIDMVSDVDSTSESNALVKLKISISEVQHRILIIQLRIPEWVDGGYITYNYLKHVSSDHCFQKPSSFCTISEEFKNGDELSVWFGLGIRTEQVQDTRQAYQNLHSILVGPHVMVGLTQQSWEINGDPNNIHEMVFPVPNVVDQKNIYKLKLESLIAPELYVTLHMNRLFVMDTHLIHFSGLDSTLELEQVGAQSCQSLLYNQDQQHGQADCKVRIGVMSLPGAQLVVDQNTGYIQFTYLKADATTFVVQAGLFQNKTDNKIGQNISIYVPSKEEDSNLFLTMLFNQQPKDILGCQDLDNTCSDWAQKGECYKNPRFMLVNCRKSCGSCTCMDEYNKCEYWSKLGECEVNAKFMLAHCAISCRACGGVLLGVEKVNTLKQRVKFEKGTTFYVTSGVDKYPVGSRILKSQYSNQKDKYTQQQYLLVPMMYVQEERYTVYFWFKDSDD